MRIILFILCLFYLSCEEEITLTLPNNGEQLVVEASIEKDCPPYVVLTKNQGYFDPIDEETYLNLFDVDVDSVKIWYNNEDGEKITKHLKKQPLSDLLDSEELAYIYLPEDATIPYDFSKEGTTYFLEISRNGEKITSQTTIPFTTPLDCVWVEQNEIAIKDWKFDIRAVYTDPSEIQNNILVRTKRIEHYERDSIYNDGIIPNPDIRNLLVDAGSDVLFNGESFETYFPRPIKGSGFPFGAYNGDHYKTYGNLDSVFIPHDVVIIKFCQIDEASLKFWRALVRQAGSNGNPFSEPINLVSNINGGMGVFTGYGSVYYKVPIIKDQVIVTQHEPTFKERF